MWGHVAFNVASPQHTLSSLTCVSTLHSKRIGNRIIKKRLHVRVEHVQQSRCAEEFKLRIKKNDELKAAAKARGETISTKRQPKGPKPGFMVEGMTLETVTPIPYDVVNDLKGGY
ncbi:BnaCnng19840D [Brassica napus]|uniref:BnaCnng19840D protein n=1 Tax=Brassica napus TaxID=3708 RepID=A0A078ILR9_BRANA|nr:BnaCnng19840D [Brassica napus]